MRDWLTEAGFPGVEEDGDALWARLTDGTTEFRADPGPDEVWRLTLRWPVRLSAPAITAWNAAHPAAALGLTEGETCLTMTAKGPEDLAVWQALTTGMIALCRETRRAQRARGEGM
ncbi:hypothetical protein [Pseudogemmobacter humi]|uniref:Type III secretion chaperone SycN n=1 Tax=Pseudogemmobacter humi TaxID=2483812 RepID=A0A3P5X4Z3_9RHOB|nr:hypothetical protein [Pseudogemmobacter humi]VDC26101.1 hypothetical protein XINFAN_01589 [Pseudogemmobacter humi]